jgi:hypothetical protein
MLSSKPVELSPASVETKRNRALTLGAVFLAAAYVVAGCVLLTPYVSNADAVSYISIAQKYARGEFGQAVNGYWSPLLSWMMAPAIRLGADPAVAAKVLSLLTGLALALGVFLLGRRFGLPRGIRFFLSFLALPVIFIRYTLLVITPDLLVATILVYFFYIIFDPDYFQKKAGWLGCGLTGAMAYFAKSYALFYVLALVIALSVYSLLRAAGADSRRVVLRKSIRTIAAVLVLSGIWIAALSLKYRKFTISTAGRIALNFLAPGNIGHFTASGPLLSPPNETAISAWEDPSVYSYRSSGRPLSSQAQAKRLLSGLKLRSVDILSLLWRYSGWPVALLLLAIILSFWPGRHSPVFLTLVSLLIYDAGYMVLGVNPRYLYINEILILLLSGYVLNLVLRRIGPGRRRLKPCLAAVLAFGFGLTPYTVSDNFKADFETVFRGRTSGPGPVLSAVSRRMVVALAGYDPGRSSGRRIRIASDVHYQRSLILAYYRKFRYFGVPWFQGGEVDIRRELKDKRIEYFLRWDSEKKKYDFLRGCPEVPLGPAARVRVYDVRRLE